MTEAEWIAFLQRPEIPVFNRAMLANTDDDLPRLVFADWLDENCPDKRICAAVRQSMNGKSHPIQFLTTPTDVSVSADRGRLTLTLERDQPPPDEHGCRALWESGWVGGVRLNSPSSAAVRAWLTHSGMASVDWLAVIQSGTEVGETIAAADHLTELRDLSLSLSFLGSGGTRAVAAAKLPALRSLDLFHCRLTDEDAIEIASAPTLASLTALDLADNEIGPTGARALANFPHLIRLQSLRLAYNGIGNEGMAAIAGSESFASLTSLDLERTELSSVQAMCRSPHLRNLTTLEVGNNPLSPHAVEELASCPHLTGLATLKISGTHMGETGVRALAGSPHLHNLRSLDLSSNPIGDAGVSALTASPLFGRLDKLTLSSCGITIAGLRALANSQRFADPRPFDLWLTGNAFGYEALDEAGGWPTRLVAAVRNAADWGVDTR